MVVVYELLVLGGVFLVVIITTHTNKPCYKLLTREKKEILPLLKVVNNFMMFYIGTAVTSSALIIFHVLFSKFWNFLRQL